jgi:uncharacterized protein YkwD
MKGIVAVLGCALAVFAARAQDAAQADMLSLVAQARTRGCTGHAGVAAPLRWSAALARVARRVQEGDAPLAAAGKENYAARRIHRTTLGGYSSAADAAGAFAQHDCAALTDASLSDFAFYRRESTWVLLLATPLELTQLGDRRAVAQQVLALANEARAQPRRCGNESFAPAPPLRADERLDRAALAHAQDMAAHEYVDHKSRDGSSFDQRVLRAGYRWRDVGENIAAGQQSAQDVVKAWLASPGHCANLMTPNFADMGVAFAVNMKSEGIVYWAQEFGRAR